MICIAWGGMPSYAACAIRSFVEESIEEVRIVATPSDVPRTCDDTIAGARIHWVKDDDKRSILEVIGELPHLLVVSGWFIPSFNSFANEVRESGGCVLALVDHRWTPTFRTFLWLLNFRLRRKSRYAGFIVPGAAGHTLLRYAFVPPSRIATGMYTADPRIFASGPALEQRPKRIVYVGRFDTRKNIQPFAEVFCHFAVNHPGWKLDCYGCGALESQLMALAEEYGQDCIGVHGFEQPEILAKVYAKSRALVLPSLEDHWGVVVHEATLCGCAVLLSREVGAAKDLCGARNGILFSPKSRKEMATALNKMASWTDDDWRIAQRDSLRVATHFSPEGFARNLAALIREVR